MARRHTIAGCCFLIVEGLVHVHCVLHVSTFAGSLPRLCGLGVGFGGHDGALRCSELTIERSSICEQEGQLYRRVEYNNA
jgi:hypothetical protein